jgi:hypothetical protein
MSLISKLKEANNMK